MTMTFPIRSEEALERLSPLLKLAYMEGKSIAGEVVRDHTGVYFRAAVVSRDTWKKMRKALEADGFPPA